MTLAFRGMPSLLLQSPHNPGCERYKASAYLANRPARRCKKLCIHCNAQSEEVVKQDDERSTPGTQSWSNDSSNGDSYAGWSFPDADSKKKNKFPGFLKIGAGIALTVGFALVSHAAWRKGFRNVIAPAPAPAVQKTFASIQETMAQALDEAESKEQEPQDDLKLEVKAEDVDAEEPAGEVLPSLKQPESTDATDSSPGQDSFPSDNVGSLSNEDVTSSAFATGAASTFASNEHAAEELSHADKESDTFQQAEEELPTPTELTAEVVSKALDSPPSEQLVQDADPTSEDVGGPTSGITEPEPVVESASTEPESSQPLFENPGAESDQPLPETTSPQSDPTLPDSITPLPSQEPLVVLASDVPVATSYTLLLAAVDMQAAQSESILGAEAARSDDFQSDVPSDSQQEVHSPTKVGASPVEDAADLNVPEAERLDSVASSPSSESELWHFTSVGIPAPSTPFLLASGRIIVPAVVDNAQEQALAALQSLKVIEPGVSAGDICTRREYARWLVSANRTLARSTSSKVLPAMYIEKVSELAFSDVLPDDPDFPFIQGLAEAGLIASKLSGENEDLKFSPDSPLSRQDLVSWKLALDNHTLPQIQLDKLKEKTGFIDLEQIHKDAWPAIAADISSGDGSIINSAFGYTRRFQPQKPVTRGQAAIALVSGDASDLVVEEMARLEAEKLAEKAVAEEIAFEARVREESNEYFREELEQQKQALAAAESLAQSLRTELDSLKAQREEEKTVLLKEKANVEAAKESASKTKTELDSMMEQVSMERVRVVFEREKLEKLLAEIEEEREVMSRLKSEMEVETKALVLARAWAEEEAKKARAHAKVLEEARKRWETQGIEVQVDKELDDINIPVPTWQFNGEKFELETKQEPKAPMQKIMVKAEEYKDKSMQLLQEAMSSSGDKLGDLRRQLISSMQQIGSKAEQVRNNTFFVVTTRAKEMQKAAANMAAGLSSMVSENTHKLANGCKGSAEKLAQIFKP